MNSICRLCLSYSSEVIQNLHENSEIMLKITSCLQVEILNEDALPNQICINCNNVLNQTHTFLKSVLENQKNLYHHLKLGTDCLESFYSSLKNVKDENKDNVSEIKKESTENYVNSELINTPIKDEVIETNIDDCIEYSSDDNKALISLSDRKHKTSISKYPRKQKHKQNSKKKRKISLESNSESIDTKENIFNNTTNNSMKILEYKCLTCFKIFDTRITLTKHYQIDHKPEVPPSCDINNYSTVEDGEGKKFKCGICEKNYPNAKYVKHHLQYRHQDSRPYICNLCGRTYKVIPEIIQHLRAHGGVKLYCSYNCGYSSVYSAGLRTHEKRHRQEYKYKCEKCGKGFDVKTWYEEHQNVHTGAKPFVCNVCGIAYHYKRYLVKHQSNSHPGATPTEQVRFVCVHCALPCDNKVALKNHLAKEHGIKQCFLCDMCGKSFKRPDHLASHKKFHLGIKNHTCSTCDKPFTTSSGLKRHELTHTGYRKYGCGKCGKRFTHRAALEKHELRHHAVPKQKIPE